MVQKDGDQPPSEQQGSTRSTGGLSSTFVFGLACIFVVIFLWVGASELIQFVFDDKKNQFAKPLFLTMYASLTFCIYLLGFLFVPSWQEGLQKSWLIWKKWREGRSEARTECDDADGEEFAALLGQDDQALKDSDEQGQAKKLPHEVFLLAVWYTGPWLVANYLFNLSLCMACGTGTSVASNTVLYSTCTLWALIIAVALKDERGSTVKFLAVFLSFVGAVMVTGMDFNKESALLGDAVILASSFAFGLLSVMLKRAVPAEEEEGLDWTMFFGFVGITHTIACIPFLLLFHVTGIETLEPISNRVLLWLTVNGVMGTAMSNVVWATAISMTSPLITNLGTSLSIPFSFLADFLNPESQNPDLHWQYVLGSVLILLSFIVVSCLEDAPPPPPPPPPPRDEEAASSVL